MVSFVSITRGISFFMLVSSMLAGPVHAAPAASEAATAFTLPPIIKSRVAFSNGIADFNLTKRASETVGGNTMDLPSNAPALPPVPKADDVVIATSAQIAEYKKYAALAATAYCRSVVPLNLWTCINCLRYAPDGKLIKTFSSVISDTNGFVLRSDSQKTIYVVFRGTNSIRSAITDLIFTLISYPPVSGARVHTGFYASYQAVVSDYFPVVQSQLTAYPSYKVVVTGHSLGGAHALLAGIDLFQREKRLSPSNLEIHTVGCPRVGNPTFANYVASTGITFTRSVNQRDVVPHVPPTYAGYLHPGVEVWSRTLGTVQICTSNTESDKCSNSIEPFTSFTDHLSYYDITEGICI
ncbi:unnamed protein product [Mucor fragilis]